MSETRTYEYKLYLGNSIEDTSEGKATLVLTKDAQEIEIDKKICIISPAHIPQRKQVLMRIAMAVVPSAAL